MALRFGGVYIKTIVENGQKTFDLSSDIAFKNSINSLSVTISQGGSSQIEVGLSPTFPDAVKIIESGYLGFGFPIQSTAVKSINENLGGGIQRIVQNQGTSGNKSSTLAVRMGYGDIGASPDISSTPWMFGIINAPDISFGEEISITLKAVSMCIKTASSDTTRNFEGETLLNVVKRVIEEDIRGEVVFTNESSLRAQKIIVNRNQSENTTSFVKNLLSDYNFKFYESGGTAKNPKLTFMVDDLAGISNGKVNFTLRMYGQINVPEKIYPIESFDTEITHVLVAGGFFGAKSTALKTKDKGINRKSQGVDTFAREIKSGGKNISGKLKEGKPTQGGPTDGPPTTRDKSRAGKRYVVVQKNDLDNEQLESVKSQTHDDLSGALSVTVTCPLIPEANPNSLVRVEIMTGDPSYPIFKTVSGIYRIVQVRHTVSDSGATTELELLRSIGDTNIENENVQAIQDKIIKSRDAADAIASSLTRGLIG